MKKLINVLLSIAAFAVLAATPAFGVDKILQNVTVTDQGDYYDVSFGCDASKKYVIYGAQSTTVENAFWFQVKTVGHGYQDATVSSDSVLTTTLPKPVLVWSKSSDTDLVKVVEVDRESVTNPDNKVGVTDIKHLGDRVRITFESTPYESYKILATDNLEDSRRWMRSDTLENGERIQTTEVYGSEGETTTVELPIPFLPWLAKDKGFLVVERISSPFSSFGRAARLVAAPGKLLVCTRDGRDDERSASSSFPYILYQHVNTSGPKVAWSGKYTTITARTKVSTDHFVSEDGSLQVPEVDDREPDVNPTIKQFVAMSEGENPEVLFLPDPSKDDGKSSDTQCHIRIQSGTVIGVAVYNAIVSLEEVIEFEYKGLKIKPKLPANASNCEVQMNWQFAVMSPQMYALFKQSITAKDE